MYLLMIIPIIGALCTMLVSQGKIGKSNKKAEEIGLISSLPPFIAAIILLNIGGIKPIFAHNVVLQYNIECDGLSLIFLLLTVIITPIAILSAERRGEMIASILLVESLLIGAFVILDLIWFFIFFESVLIPMYFLIGGTGSGKFEFRVEAAYRLFLYTLTGSVLMLIAIIIIYLEIGSTNLHILQLTGRISPEIQNIIFPLIFIAFAVKVPMVPIHLWLPKAHVEAPTCGSVILAALLLKLGGYGFIRWLFIICPIATINYGPMVMIMSVIGIIYSSLTTLRQTDLKKIIAYSSISHMSYIVYGLFSLNQMAVEGAIYQMISHGIISAGLFSIIGNLYNRYGTRILKYYRGLSGPMPIFSIIFFLYTLANISVPLTSSFVGEFLIMAGSFEVAPLITIIACVSVLFGTSYGIWMYNRICFGTISPYIDNYRDLTRSEFYAHVPLILLAFLFGIYPSIVIDIFHESVSLILLPFSS